MHGPRADEAGALRLWGNAADPVPLPEWRNRASLRHRDSVAAYGELLREDGRLVYRRLPPRPQEVRVYAAVADQGHAGEAAVTFELS
jgi:hypothetical protein